MVGVSSHTAVREQSVQFGPRDIFAAGRMATRVAARIASQRPPCRTYSCGHRWHRRAISRSISLARQLRFEQAVSRLGNASYTQLELVQPGQKDRHADTAGARRVDQRQRQSFVPRQAPAATKTRSSRPRCAMRRRAAATARAWWCSPTNGITTFSACGERDGAQAGARRAQWRE